MTLNQTSHRRLAGGTVGQPSRFAAAQIGHLIGALQPSFLTVDTLLVVMADTATLFILATGMTFVVMLGGLAYRSGSGVVEQC
jgi:ribose/xylose/arabinose/galactoside ABC-type transport system permease subunit